MRNSNEVRYHLSAILADGIDYGRLDAGRKNPVGLQEECLNKMRRRALIWHRGEIFIAMASPSVDPWSTKHRPVGKA